MQLWVTEFVKYFSVNIYKYVVVGHGLCKGKLSRSIEMQLKFKLQVSSVRSCKLQYAWDELFAQEFRLIESRVVGLYSGMDNCQEHNTEAGDAEAPEIQYCLATVSVFQYLVLMTWQLRRLKSTSTSTSASASKSKSTSMSNQSPHYCGNQFWQYGFLGSADTWPPFMVSSPLAVT